MSIVRIGLAETKNFAEGYDAIFGGKKKAGQKPRKRGDDPTKQTKRVQSRGRALDLTRFPGGVRSNADYHDTTD